MKKLIASLVVAAAVGLAHAGYESEQITGNGFSGHAFYASSATTCYAQVSNGSGTAQIHGPNGSVVAGWPYPNQAWGNLAAGNYYMYVNGGSPDAAAYCTVSW